MSTYDMEAHIDKLERENKLLRLDLATLRKLFPQYTPMFNGNGLEAAQADESVEETYFRLIIESQCFDAMDPREREMFLLEIAQQCITWVQERENY